MRQDQVLAHKAFITFIFVSSMKPRQLGIAILVLSIAVVALMITFKIQYDERQLNACAEVCGEEGVDSCSVASCPYHNSGNLGLIPLIASILVSGLGGIGVYLLFSKGDKIIHEREYDLSGLDEEEKKVFHMVKEKQEGIYQSQIVDSLDVSKVKVTRILDKLEQRELVERKRRGMTNVVVVR